jgi:hypothetical protein
VRIHEELSAHRITFQEYMYKRERRNLIDLEDEIAEKGTSHDKLILKLHNSVIIEPTGTLPNPVTFRELTLEEFQQFRSKVEPMSEEEIAEEIRKAKEEFERKSASKPKPDFPKGGPRV